ncbi:MAG: DUF4918 family protein [Saprospiraceae bacterium]|nr:DUF4918 family protein [Saprospiraceae bacterium]
MPLFSEKVIHFTRQLRPDWQLPAGVTLLYPYALPATMEALSAFYRKYYADEQSRIFIFGINPGRFGAGITGVPFTDPIRLESECGIPNSFEKKAELSSQFVYQFVQAYGGGESFYGRFYITSLSPLGFTKEGKNYNYYDDKQLQQSVTPYILDNIRTQMAFGTTDKVALCLGEGQNYKFFQQLNTQHGFFERILPLPHPRWVMQYRRKRSGEFVDFYLRQFELAWELGKG